MDYFQENDDLVIENGDFVKTDNPTEEYKKDLVLETIGEDKFFPLRAVNAFQFLNQDAGRSALRRKIKEVVKLDGGTVSNIQVFENGNIEFELSYD